MTIRELYLAKTEAANRRPTPGDWRHWIRYRLFRLRDHAIEGRTLEDLDPDELEAVGNTFALLDVRTFAETWDVGGRAKGAQELLAELELRGYGLPAEAADPELGPLVVVPRIRSVFHEWERTVARVTPILEVQNNVAGPNVVDPNPPAEE